MADVDAEVLAAAARSTIAAYRWKNRGKAPSGYINGMALAFAIIYRELTANDPIAQAIATPPIGDPAKDALDLYAEELAAAGIEGTAAAERLIQVFTLLLGLGMRESSGKHCEGRDMSADNVSGETAEAGLFQVSYDSVQANLALSRLIERYRGRSDLLAFFAEGVHCSAASWADWGDGAGREFQELTKECPLFAVAYAAVLLRHGRKHWGPINRKEAEVRPDAADLFRHVKNIVDAH